MIDKEHDTISYEKLMVWIVILGGSVWFWYSIFTNGFFVSVMWLIVISAIIGLYFRLSGKA